jgi:hypothetical protein
MLEYNEMMSILFVSQQPVAPKLVEGGSTLSCQPSAELLQKTFDRMK